MRKLENDGGAAFPTSFHHEGETLTIQGMTLRDWFAGQALMGLLENYRNQDIRIFEDFAGCSARQAYLFADAMIAERGNVS